MFSVLYLEIARLERNREAVARAIYVGSYSGPATSVAVLGELGLEEPKLVDAFLDVAARMIDTSSRELTIDLRRCSRVWPSGVTLLCSLAKWIELCGGPGNQPIIRSTRSQTIAVDHYLKHCGFAKFVRLSAVGADQSSVAFSDVAPIQRETSRYHLEQREDEIVALLGRLSRLSSRELELFDSLVLTEVFANITEHGVRRGDEGWWILAQHHPKHEIISLCLADNGIGIRNSLASGPQGQQIGARLGASAGDGEYLALALRESVSGALDAVPRDPRWLGLAGSKYPRGAHRGNGFKRILETCSDLGVPFSLLSHAGFASSRRDRNIDSRSLPARVFGGTMYHFAIPARGA